MRDEYDWTLFAWAIDLVRCIESMPKWKRLLIRIALGRYAAREYVGLRERIEKNGDRVSDGYDIEGAKYHQEKWKWFR